MIPHVFEKSKGSRKKSSRFFLVRSARDERVWFAPGTPAHFPSGFEGGAHACHHDDEDAECGPEADRLVEEHPSEDGRKDDGGVLQGACQKNAFAAPGTRHAELSEDPRDRHAENGPAVLQGEYRHGTLEKEVANERGNGPREGEVKDDAPLGFVKFRHLSHLELRKRGEESRGEADEPGKEVRRVDVRVEDERDAEKAQNDAEKELPLQGVVPSQGDHDRNRRHPQRIRVVERHRGAERQVCDGVKPNQKRGGAEDAALEVTPEIGRTKRASAGDDEAVEYESCKELAVKDKFVRAERIGAELRKGRHQGKE